MCERVGTGDSYVFDFGIQSDLVYPEQFGTHALKCVRIDMRITESL